MGKANLILMLPEIFLACMALLVLMVGVFWEHKLRYITYRLSIFTVFVTGIFAIGTYSESMQAVINNSYLMDNFSAILKFILCILMLCIFLYSKVYIDIRKFLHAEFFALSLFSLLGMMVLTSAADFLTMFLGLELFVLPLYATIVMVKHQGRYAEAAIKYFIIGSLGAGLLLYGISLVYGATGSFDFSAVSGVQDLQHILQLGMILILLGIALEFGAVPFHMWLPDVYEGSATAVTMLIGTLPKIAIFAIAYRVLSLAFGDVALYWQQVILILGLLSVIIGNIAAIAQYNIKRMLAYSTIGHVGFILLGIAVAPQQGYLAPLFYTIIYAFMALAAFALIMRLTAQGFEAENIEDFRGLNRHAPWLAFLMLLTMFALAGVPPLVGFYAKFLILQNMVANGLSWAAILALIFAVIGTFYYLRVVKVMYFEEPSAHPHAVAVANMSFVGRSIVFINALALLALGVIPGLIVDICLKAFR
jgi:NADH-quinone oxidoreductase subunit N